MLWLVLALIPLAFAISAPVVALTLRLSIRAGAIDPVHRKGQERFSSRPIPNTGGIGITVAILVPVLAALAAAWTIDVGSLLPALEPHVPGIRARTPLALTAVAAAVLLHAVGLVDDRLALPPGVKLAAMTVAAVAVVSLGFATGDHTRLLTLLDDPLGGPWASALITILWIVVVINALNFIDNMDGLAAGVASIASACFLAAALVNGQWFVAALLALVIGACLGFLCFNFPPARIYMGDAGSLVLGFLLALLTVRTTYYSPDTHARAWYALLMPPVVLAVPLYDFASVCLIRIRQGRSPFVGDTQHFSHRLVRRGCSVRATLAIICGITACTGIAGVALGSLLPWQAALVGLQVLLMMAVLALFEWSVPPARNSP